MDSYEYIAIFDIDEILVPRDDISIPDLMDSIRRHKKADTVQFESYYFPKTADDSTKEM